MHRRWFYGYILYIYMRIVNVCLLCSTKRSARVRFFFFFLQLGGNMVHTAAVGAELITGKALVERGRKCHILYRQQMPDIRFI